MDAYFATIPTHFVYIYQMIKQNKITECDLYYTDVTKDAGTICENARETGLFRNVYLLPNISIEYPITARRCIDISLKKFPVMKLLKDKKYDSVYYNVDGWLYNSIIYNGLKKSGHPFKNIFVENGLNPYITSYDTKEWYLRLFINLNGMTCMDGRFIDERYVFEPDMIGVRQSGVIKKIDKIDVEDSFVRDNLNRTFRYNKETDSFRGKDIIIIEQAPRKEPIDMVTLWRRVGSCLDGSRVIIKSHPRQADSELRKLGYDVYDRYTIPWEVSVMNENVNDKTMICIFSTACVNPKVMFDQEPRVIMLYKLIGRDYSFFGEGMLGFVDKVRKSYRDPSRFFIPESWEEFEDYCRTHLT